MDREREREFYKKKIFLLNRIKEVEFFFLFYLLLPLCVFCSHLPPSRFRYTTIIIMKFSRFLAFFIFLFLKKKKGKLNFAAQRLSDSRYRVRGFRTDGKRRKDFCIQTHKLKFSLL
jgi:hypothetical protein